MTGARVIVYDCEIKKAIPDKKRPRDPALQYCEGWGDYAGMGISVIAAVDVEAMMPRVFFGDNLVQFADYTRGAIVCGFSSHDFDDKLVQAHGLFTAAGRYDILRKLRKAVGEPEGFVGGVTRGGRTVNDCARVNLNGLQKSDDGANAPALFQQGKLGELVDYCLRDVMIELKLLLRRGAFVDPVTGQIVVLEEPSLVPAAAALLP